MAAGLTRRQRNAKVYRRLLTLKYKLALAGVRSHYNRFQLAAEVTGLNAGDNGFNVSYGWSQASNGECAGFPYVSVYIDGAVEKYGHLQAAGDYNKGIQRVIELFSRVAPDQRRLFATY